MTVCFDQREPFFFSVCSNPDKSELVVVPYYVTLSVIWQITSGTGEKNKRERFPPLLHIHVERARVRGFTRKAKYIPRGIADNGYGGGGVNCSVLIKVTSSTAQAPSLIKENAPCLTSIKEMSSYEQNISSFTT